jgi:hypothetical protein
LPSFRTPILGSVKHEYEAQGGRAGTLKLPRLLLALSDLLNNDRFVQHCSDPMLNSSQLRHAALAAGHRSAPLAPVLLDPTRRYFETSPLVLDSYAYSRI